MLADVLQKRSSWNKGIPHTEEHKRKISEAQKGRIGGMKGKKHTEETKRKMSRMKRGHLVSMETRKKIGEANIGKMLGKHNGLTTEFQKGHIPWSKGKRRCYSKETLDKMKMAKIGKYGEETGNWKDGITPKNLKIRASIEYRLWREAVFARDNWTCQKCNKRGSCTLHAHHIQNFAEYPELRFAIDNGITFCRECHRGFHKKYGFKNNTKEQLKDFNSL